MAAPHPARDRILGGLSLSHHSAGPPAKTMTSPTRFLLPLAFLLAAASPASAQAVFINEVNYDVPGPDATPPEGIREFFELAGPVGTDLSGYTLVRYDGANGMSYGSYTVEEGKVIVELEGGADRGVGVFAFPFDERTASDPAQNGPDGIALVAPDGVTVLEFLSYGGAPFVATNGPAVGLTSVEIGTDPGPATGQDQSLQLAGDGRTRGDFTWTVAASTLDRINVGQTITPATDVAGGVEPVAAALEVFPNPSRGQATVVLDGAAGGHARVAVYDALGREVALVYDGPVAGEVRLPIRTGDLRPGAFVVRALTPDGALTHAFTVVR